MLTNYVHVNPLANDDDDSKAVIFSFATWLRKDCFPKPLSKCMGLFETNIDALVKTLLK